MNRVRLYFVKLGADNSWAQINSKLYEQWLSELSLQKQASIRRLINGKDRISSLLGLRLLMSCALDEEIIDFQLSDIRHPESGKPYLHGNSSLMFDFNISHSDDLILVAMSTTSKVGVDAEKIRNLKSLNFKMVMSVDELDKIRQTPDLFFDLWSKKEAVVKAADTAGISRMRDVKLENESAILDDQCWHIEAVHQLMELGSVYSAHLASSQPVDELIVKQMLLNDLID